MGLFVYVNLIFFWLYILITYQSVAVYIMLHLGLYKVVIHPATGECFHQRWLPPTACTYRRLEL